jgi:hypothetical protein
VVKRRKRDDNHLVLFWKRDDGVRCVALKHPAARAVAGKRWELRVWTGDRLVKHERFATFRRTMRAAELWRTDFAVGAVKREADQSGADAAGP